jgi:hypothetical protein
MYLFHPGCCRQVAFQSRYPGRPHICIFVTRVPIIMSIATPLGLPFGLDY